VARRREENHSVSFSGSYAEGIEERAARRGMHVIGTLHSPPGSGVTLRESGDDIECWRRLSRNLGRTTAHLLLGEDDRDTGFPWLRPRMKCFVVTRFGDVRQLPIEIEKETYQP
jgi:proteasome lid subunit RPN8/RPN11